jgi:hypothetical protein
MNYAFNIIIAGTIFGIWQDSILAGMFMTVALAILKDKQ